jgi:hypothetical protein
MNAKEAEQQIAQMVEFIRQEVCSHAFGLFVVNVCSQLYSYYFFSGQREGGGNPGQDRGGVQHPEAQPDCCLEGQDPRRIQEEGRGFVNQESHVRRSITILFPPFSSFLFQFPNF